MHTPNHNIEFEDVPALDNGSGGVLAIWDKDCFRKENSFWNQRWLCITGRFLEEDFECALCIVYGANDPAGRLEIWNQLRLLKPLLLKPLILMGDFNEVIHYSKRRGALQMSESMIDFGNLVHDLHLIDMDIDIMFTWMRQNSASRIDRFFVDNEVLLRFDNLRVSSSGRYPSDHHPLVLKSSESRWGPSPFRSLDCWLEAPDFLELFTEEWVQLAGLSLGQKLKSMKQPLKKWNEEIFGNIDKKIEELRKEIKKNDQKAQETTLEECDLYRRKALQSTLWLWDIRKERYWRQHSRCTLLKEGDRNTKFFHLTAQ